MTCKLQIIRSIFLTSYKTKLSDNEQILVKDLLTGEIFWCYANGVNLWIGQIITYKDITEFES